MQPRASGLGDLARIRSDRTLVAHGKSRSMKITRIAVYRVELPLHEGSYKWSGGKSVAVFDSTIVAVETDAGVTGYGEVCPLGPFYLPAYATGVRGRGSPSWGRICWAKIRASSAASTAGWTRPFKGHPYVKSAHRHRLLGHPGQGDRPARLHAAGRAVRRRLCPLSGDLAAVAGGNGRPRCGISRARATADSSSRSAAIRTLTLSESAPWPAVLRTWRPAGRRRQYGLADARRPARGPGRARRRRLYRTTVPGRTKNV